MKTIKTLIQIELNTEQKELLCSIINRFGTGQHPVADEKTIDYFETSYIKDILASDEFIVAKSKLSDKGIDVLTSINLV